MEAYLLDWANLLLRWAHVVVVIAWIGSSFYFVFLDASLTEPEHEAARADGVTGELWAVHGGGFYHPQKYAVSPPVLPERLHWFYWESYSTWLTGFALFALMYLLQARSFLIDPTRYAWSSPVAAGAAALGFLAVFWVLYDAVCRAFGHRRRGDAVVAIGVVLLVAAASWLACALFAGRAAFVLVGAMLATAMSANVFFVIIPGQRRVVAQLRAGQSVDPRLGARAKQRSVHNTYFTLPVLFAMLSPHYGFVHGVPHNAAVLVALMTAGALVRHSFVARHRARVAGRGAPWGYALAGVVLIGGVAVAVMPPLADGAAARAGAAGTPPVAFTDVERIVAQRCAACHNAELANKGVQLHTPALIAKNAQALYQQTVVLRAMPINNATGITDAERAVLGRWFETGAARP